MRLTAQQKIDLYRANLPKQEKVSPERAIITARIIKRLEQEVDSK